MVLHGIILDRDSRVSLRRQLVGHLESRILGGQIGPGRRLPSVRRAEEYLGLHRNTVAAAYGDLVRSGLVRTRPGSGVYVSLEGGDREAGVPRLTARESGRLDLICPDSDLGAVLRAELEVRLSVRVRSSMDDGESGTTIRLSPSVGFVRRIRSVAKPCLVAVVSRSDRIHRLASIAVLIHGGEGTGYLPVSPAKHGDLGRMERLTSNIFADYAELAAVRRSRLCPVAALPVISSLSVTAATALMRRCEVPRGLDSVEARSAERSLREGVTQP